MVSVFPGMDPYLEHGDVWHDFHEQFCLECRALLVPQLGPAYIAKVDEHIYVHELETADRRLGGRADVSVAESRGNGARPQTGGVAVAPAQCQVEASVDLERSAYVEIRDHQNRELITVIELLSPSNKRPGRDRDQYLGKRAELLTSSVHLVELDLLRSGPRMPITDLPECDYYALVSRSTTRPQADVWPIGLRDPLPSIPIPLRDGDADVTLDLRRALDQSFDAAGYAAWIYGQQPQPPLSEDDADWAAQWIAAPEQAPGAGN